ncbi:MAG: phosphoribosylanthranilate isomerase [Myxococcales bacterium]|nr:phosphoribosylanthranilate isomerase [Myxococcales bacterium]
MNEEPRGLIVKMCGMTTLDDALAAVDAGADWLGFNFWSPSKRYVPPELAGKIISRLPNSVSAVGIFVNHPVIEINRIVKLTKIDMVQLHGDESNELLSQVDAPAFRAIRLRTADDIAKAIVAAEHSRVSVPKTTLSHEREPMLNRSGLCLVDTYDPFAPGGTGRLINRELASQVAHQCVTVVAGGLTPDNVFDMVVSLPVSGVDVAGGIEQSAGVKDRDKMFRFVENARKGWRERLKTSEPTDATAALRSR